MKFELEITCGNEAMESSEDIAQALDLVAESLRNSISRMSGIIRDRNGNKVGEWSVAE